MKRAELIFDRPSELSATAPAEARGKPRDAARLMVSTPCGHFHTQFRELARFFQPGDVLVVNESATLPASLPAHGRPGDFIINFATDYGGGLWLAEPRWSSSQPGPLPLQAGDVIDAGGVQIRLVSQFPGLPRLWFVRTAGDVRAAMNAHGAPIRYGYVDTVYPLDVYQTVFARVPGSAEMPSAAYPFTESIVDELRANGVEIAPLVLHTGVSSLEVEVDDVESHPLYPEPFAVPQATADAINAARADGRRVIALGTTVVRALESACEQGHVRAISGFTRAYIHPGRGVRLIDGLITGMHDPITSHLAMLYAVAGQSLIRSAYDEAIREGYLWHEFGDTHLIFAESAHACAHVEAALAVA